jgi:hypothetical protein
MCVRAVPKPSIRRAGRVDAERAHCTQLPGRTPAARGSGDKTALAAYSNAHSFSLPSRHRLAIALTASRGSPAGTCGISAFTPRSMSCAWATNSLSAGTGGCSGVCLGHGRHVARGRPPPLCSYRQLRLPSLLCSRSCVHVPPKCRQGRYPLAGPAENRLWVTSFTRDPPPLRGGPPEIPLPENALPRSWCDARSSPAPKVRRDAR